MAHYQRAAGLDGVGSDAAVDPEVDLGYGLEFRSVEVLFHKSTAKLSDGSCHRVEPC